MNKNSPQDITELREEVASPAAYLLRALCVSVLAPAFLAFASWLAFFLLSSPAAGSAARRRFSNFVCLCSHYGDCPYV